MSSFDALHPPPASDPTARSYKDWLHLNVLDADNGLVALINVSLHGPVDDRRSRAVGVALATIGETWTGGIEIAGYPEASIKPQGILLETISLAVTPDQQSIRAAIRRSDDGLGANLVAIPAASPFSFDLRAPLGSGWISWWAVPLLRVSGEMLIDGRRIDLNNAIAYHDHNWGRWHWGDDAGWEWGAFAFPEIGAVFVFARSSDKAHETLGPIHLSVQRGASSTRFAPEHITVELAGTLGDMARRIPGALAAVHADRRNPGLPAQFVITADDGVNAARLVLDARTAAQLILAEPTRPGYSFINEIAGHCRVVGRINDVEFAASGVGIFEYVE